FVNSFSLFSRSHFTSDYVVNKKIEDLIEEGLTYHDIITSECSLSHFVESGLQWTDFVNIGLRASNIQRYNCFDIRVLVDEWKLTGDQILKDLMLSPGQFLIRINPALTELEALQFTLRVFRVNGL